MRFKQYLTELFKEKKDFKVTDLDRYNFEAIFEVNNVNFEFAVGYDEDDERWVVTFASMGGGEPLGITKDMGKKAIEVYSYIITLVKYFIKLYDPDEVYLEGNEPEQGRIYKKLVNKFKKEIESMGYDIEETHFGIYLVKEQ